MNQETTQGLEQLDAVVVGTGFSGIYQLHKLREQGFSAIAFETGDDVGGTWYWNCYPGARCDSESHYYQYTFSDDLLRNWQWSERFPAGTEVQRYLSFVTDRLGLRPHIRFSCRVTSAVYDESDDHWLVETDRGDRVRARYCIMATGFASKPQVPDIPGLADFAGEWHHTARWPRQGVDFGGRRVGVIGTGATGVQVIQQAAPRASHLTVFQRTPIMAMPMQQRPMDDATWQAYVDDMDSIRASMRRTFGGFTFDFDERLATEVSAEEREALYEELWQAGGLRFWVNNFMDLLMDERANATAYDFLRRKVHERVKDPDMAEALCPKTPPHPFGTKRPSLEQGYFEVFNRDNVTLVDTRQTPIERITSGGVIAGGVEHPLDVIAFATGFDAVTGGLAKIDIRGRDGVGLAERWADGPRSYLGMQAVDFPNLFWLYGPQSPSGFANGPSAIEPQVEWLTDCLVHMRREGLRRIEPTERAQEDWVAMCDQAVSETLFPKADSWYMGANIPGKPRQILLYPLGMGDYYQRCSQVAANGYEGFALA